MLDLVLPLECPELAPRLGRGLTWSGQLHERTLALSCCNGVVHDTEQAGHQREGVPALRTRLGWVPGPEPVRVLAVCRALVDVRSHYWLCA